MLNLERAIAELPGPYVVMGVGMPGSGKSTRLREVEQTLGIARICPDDIRAELTGSEMDQSANTEVWAEAARRAEELLASGESVILDATHAEARRRPEAIAQYRGFGALTIAAAVFDVPLGIALARNSARERVVPPRAIHRMHRALQNQPVSLDEGFDRVFRVR